MAVPPFLCFLFYFAFSLRSYLRNFTNHIDLGLWYVIYYIKGLDKRQSAIGHELRTHS